MGAFIAVALLLLVQAIIIFGVPFILQVVLGAFGIELSYWICLGIMALISVVASWFRR